MNFKIGTCFAKHLYRDSFLKVDAQFILHSAAVLSELKQKKFFDGEIPRCVELSPKIMSERNEASSFLSLFFLRCGGRVSIRNLCSDFRET